MSIDKLNEEVMPVGLQVKFKPTYKHLKKVDTALLFVHVVKMLNSLISL